MKWVIIGASTIAREWVIDAIRQQPGNEIVGVVEANADYGRSYAEQQSIPAAYTTLGEALDANEVDAVYVSSGNDAHYADAMGVIAGGKHLLCEKPLALTVKDAAEIVQAAEDRGLVFGTNHNMRCAGSHQTIREIVASGRLGRLLSVRIGHAFNLPPRMHGWRTSSSAIGGVTFDVTSHSVDIMRYLIGEDPVSVVAEKAQLGLGVGVEDTAMSVWTLPSGVLVSSHESYNHPYAVTSLDIHGTEGAIFARDTLIQQARGTVELLTEAGREQITFPAHNHYVETVRMFEEAVRGRGTPACTGWDGVKSLAVVEAVRKAARTGVRVAVEYPRI